MFLHTGAKVVNLNCNIKYSSWHKGSLQGVCSCMPTITLTDNNQNVEHCKIDSRE